MGAMKLRDAINCELPNALQSAILSDGSEITMAKESLDGRWLAPITFSQSFAQNLRIDLGLGVLRLVMGCIQLQGRAIALFGAKDKRKEVAFLRTITGDVLKLEPPTKFSYNIRRGYFYADEPTLAVPCSTFEIGSVRSGAAS